MNRIWKRLVGIIGLVLIGTSLMAAPLLADPINPPTWPPTSDSVVIVPEIDTTTVLPLAE